tara:strand:+ start:536 stop:667 length:132 start_codon:yes stop_codon:yes gene_type:complete
VSLALNVVALLLVAYLVGVSLSRIQAMRGWANGHGYWAWRRLK